MSSHPYKSLPNSSFWRGSVSGLAADQVDPVIQGKFRIGATDRVATAGSCFAQHIARHLRGSGFNHFVSEPAHSFIPAHLSENFGFGLYTARYGNVYTSRQLLQLLQRAYGQFRPVEDSWDAADGYFVDPFRPRIQPRGFASEAEYKRDRLQHFAAVRKAVEELNVFVFTLGLTETWASRIDGAVYPLCPGVAGGVFDASRHALLNLSVAEVTEDLRRIIRFIRDRNSGARIILTVSPVPLVATAEPRSVLLSTTYSKAVLRVAAEEVSNGDDLVAYFPSYEIITGNHTRGRYFADDLRSVTEEGVTRVMALFMQHYTASPTAEQSATSPPDPNEQHKEDDRRQQAVAQVIGVMCDEEALDE
jgi:GSCFA family